MTRYKLFRDFFIFFLYFSIEHFCRDIVKFYQFFRVVLLQIHFGSGDARIRIRNVIFRIRIRILLKVSDPTGSTLQAAHWYGTMYKANFPFVKQGWNIWYDIS
jgi:hypothetical protein